MFYTHLLYKIIYFYTWKKKFWMVEILDIFLVFLLLQFKNEFKMAAP